MENEAENNHPMDEIVESAQLDPVSIPTMASTTSTPETPQDSAYGAGADVKKSEPPQIKDTQSQERNKQRKHTGDIIGQQAVFHQYTQSPPPQSRNSPADPTQPFQPHRPSSQQQPKFQRIEAVAPSYVDRLIEEGLLVISCAHEALLQTAALTIIYHERLEDFGQRTVDLDLDEEGRALPTLVDANRISCIGETMPGKGDGGINSIVVVDLCEKTSMTQLERYARRLNRNRFWTKSELFYLFRLSGPALTMVAGRSSFSELPRWHINALPEILAEFDGEGNLASIQDALANSRAAGLWSNEECDFLRDIENVLYPGGLKALQREIKNRQATQTDQQPPAKAKGLLRGANVAEKAALFVAVFFSECTIHQFTKILGLLVEDESVEQIYQEDFIHSDTNQITTQNIRRRVAAKEWWDIYHEDAMDRLGLEFNVHPEGKTVVRFTQPAMKTGVRDAFRGPVMIRYFDRLHAAGVLLDPSTPKSLVDALVELTTEMSVQHSDVYNDVWLIERLAETMGHIQDYAHQAGRVLTVIGPESADLESLLQLVAKEWRSYHSQLFSRLTVLCRGFLNNSRSARITHAFLDQLIGRTQPDGIAALEIIRRLRGVPDFDHLSRMHHLLEVGNFETCRQVVGILLEEMEDSPEAYWTVLRQIAEWHPPQDILQKRKPLSTSQHWSLAFLYIVYDVMRDKNERLRNKRLEIPVSPLFATLDELPPLNERLLLIANWLGHPAFPQAIATMLEKNHAVVYEMMNVSTGEESSIGDYCVAQMLEFWNWEVSDQAVSKLAQLLARRLARTSLIHLRVFIRKHFSDLTDAISNTPDVNKRSDLISRRRKADQLSRSLVPLDV